MAAHDATPLSAASFAAPDAQTGAMLQSVDGARYPRALSAVVNNRNVYGGSLPEMRQFDTDGSEQTPPGAPGDARAAAADVPPSASITSDEVSRSMNCEALRIAMHAKIIHWP